MDSLDEQPKWQNVDMRFGIWNVRSMYWVGSLMTVLRHVSKPKLDLVGVQVVWWQGSENEPADRHNVSDVRQIEVNTDERAWS
jgi:hypothetical protein